MKFVNALVSLWGNHGTKVLGYATSIVAGFIAIPDLIAVGHVKYWAASNVVLGVLTIGRGHANTKAIAASQEDK